MGFSRQEYWSGVPLPSLQNIPKMKYHLTLVRMIIIKKLQIIYAGEGVKESEPSCTVDGNVN